MFGGETLTTTDIVVAAGRIELGDPSKVAELDKDLIARTEARIADMLEAGGRAVAALARSAARHRRRRRLDPGQGTRSAGSKC